MIKVEELFHHFWGKPVLNGPSFEVNPGEIVVVMGPNGMGKSTMLSAIGGGLVPRGGRIFIGGLQRYSDENSEMAVRQKVMYLPDSPWAPKSRTCRQWATAVALLYRDDERFVIDHVQALIELFEMEKVADSPMSSYSAGQKKKATLILAMAPEAPVMILDEPFSGGLDPTGLLAIKELLRKRAHLANSTVLIATPTPELVEEVADRIVILRNGEIAAQGTLADLRQQAGFEGSLEGLYERISSSQVEENLTRYEEEYLKR